MFYMGGRADVNIIFQTNLVDKDRLLMYGDIVPLATRLPLSGSPCVILPRLGPDRETDPASLFAGVDKRRKGRQLVPALS
jgi:hypothetical protein